MKRLTLLSTALALILAGCDQGDPVGNVPDDAEAAYADAFRHSAAAPATLRSAAPNAAGKTSVDNGSFETGDFSGWTAVTTGGPFRPWAVSAAGQGSGFGMAPTQPQDGSFAAWNGFDGNGPMQFVLFQDVEVGQGIPTLMWMDRAQWNFTLGGPATLPRTVTVEVRDPATNAVLGTVYDFSTGTQAQAPTGDTGWQERMADLSEFRGQSVRLAFVQSVPQFRTGPGQYELDGVTFDRNGRGGAKLFPSAQVLNRGKSTPDGVCGFNGRVTTQVTFVRTPRGGGTLSCHWDAFDFAGELEGARVVKDVSCFLNFGGVRTTTDDGRFVLTPAKTATLTCQFENLT